MSTKGELEEELSLKAIELAGSSASELERCCWMIVHEYHHGTFPFEYDVRDIDEALYLNVLNYAKNKILEVQSNDKKSNHP